jgi:hypothetical protein
VGHVRTTSSVEHETLARAYASTQRNMGGAESAVPAISTEGDILGRMSAGSDHSAVKPIKDPSSSRKMLRR